MGKIFIESKPVRFTGKDHLYLVYQDDNGNETVIRGGPERPPPFFGEIVLQIDIPIEQSEDAREGKTAEERGQRELDLDGRSAEAVWLEMQRVAQKIQKATTDYDVLGDNSNRVIRTLLKATCVPSILPGNTTAGDVPGWHGTLTEVLDESHDCQTPPPTPTSTPRTPTLPDTLVPFDPLPWNPPDPRRDPLAFDLNGDGSIETLARDEGVFFDLDNSGFAEQTSWVAPSDGFLVLDRNQNNKIDGGAELFGTETLLSTGEYAENGYEALTDFDINADGQINSDDAIFGDLRIWQDSDSDGIADEGELHTLNALDIVSIDVAYESDQFTTDSHNVEHRERSLFTYDNGTTGLTNTLWFDSDRGNTVPVEVQNGDGIVIPDDVALLPDVKGFGNAYTLHQAMALDDSGKLKALVQAFVAESDITLRKALVGDILVLWTGQQDTDPASRGNDIDGQHLGILETFWGQAAFQENPDGQYARVLEGVYEGLERSVYTRLMADSHADQLFNLLSFTQQNDIWVGDFTIVSAHFAERFASGNIFTVAKLANFAAELADFIEVVRGINPYTDTMYRDFVTALELAAASLDLDVRGSMLEVVRAGDDRIEGTDSGESIRGYAGHDVIEGLAGNDILDGGDGNDQLLGGQGADFLLGGDGNDNLQGQHSGDLLSGDAGDDRLYGGAGDDELWGGDGRDYLYGGDGDDTLRGGAGSDSLHGGDGDDTLHADSGDSLHGGAGNDTYLFGAGDGNTRVDNHDTGTGRHDVLRLLEGIASSDVTASRSHGLWYPNYNDLHLTIGSTGEVITVSNYFRGDGAGGYALDAIEFADGTSWDVDTVKAKVLQGTDGDETMTGFASDDVMNGGDGNDTIWGEDGDDTLHGGAGRDYLLGGNGDDTLHGGAGRDSLFGGNGDDTLNGGDGRDNLYGSNGDDTLRGGAGSGDFLNGGSGNDTYLFGAGDGNTTVSNHDTGADRHDVLRFLEGIAASDVTASRSWSRHRP